MADMNPPAPATNLDEEVARIVFETVQQRREKAATLTARFTATHEKEIRAYSESVRAMRDFSRQLAADARRDGEELQADALFRGMVPEGCFIVGQWHGDRRIGDILKDYPARAIGKVEVKDVLKQAEDVQANHRAVREALRQKMAAFIEQELKKDQDIASAWLPLPKASRIICCDSVEALFNQAVMPRERELVREWDCQQSMHAPLVAPARTPVVKALAAAGLGNKL